MKHQKKQLLSLLLSVSLFFGTTSVPAEDFSSDTSSFNITAEEDTASSVEDIFISDSPTPDEDPTQQDLIITEEESSITTTPDDEFSDPASSEASDFPDFSSGDPSSQSEEELFSSGTSAPTEPSDYILGRPMTDEEIQQQLALMGNAPAFSPEPDPESKVMHFRKAGFMPSSYDSRQHGLITSVKNQNPFNICWAFSLASNFETSLLKQGMGTWDLSEEHLAYFFANRVNDPLGNTPNDKITHLGKNYHENGNGMVASFHLSTWSGMVTENKAPLPTNDSHTADLSQPLDPLLAYNTDVYLENAVFSSYSEARLKQLLLDYGSVSAMIFIDTKGNYYRAETAAACYPASGKVNHAITIVGWDDNYSKSNFPSASNVQSDGAWIVKNSYGPSWGKDGYFYLSYADASITNLVCNTAITSPRYPNNYFYDGAAAGTASITLKPGASIANVFTATAGNGNAEELGEIILSSKQDSTNYRIQIYTDLKNPSDPTSGTPAFSAPLEYTQPLAGIHTLKLATPVKLVQGTKYSIVLTLPNGGKYYVEATTSSASGNWFQANAGLEAGQSFSSSNGKTWVDCALNSKFCFCIKAHTKTLDAPAVITPSPSPTPTATPTAVPTPKFRITYKANTRMAVGNMPTDNTEYVSGSTAKIKYAPYCNSRFFLGWNTRADGKGTNYSPGKTIALKNNLTLYAKWGVECIPSSKLIYRVTGKYTVACCGTKNPNVQRISIPSTIRYMGITYKVTTVWTKAFANKKQLSKVIIGNNVSVIGSRAFYNCRKLNRITIGTGLRQINTYAFGKVKRGCIIKINSTRLNKITSKIDYYSPQMLIRVPRRKLSYYNRLFHKRSRTIVVKGF